MADTPVAILNTCAQTLDSIEHSIGELAPSHHSQDVLAASRAKLEGLLDRVSAIVAKYLPADTAAAEEESDASHTALKEKAPKINERIISLRQLIKHKFDAN